MTSFFSWIARTFDFFSRRRKFLFLIVFSLVAGCLYFLKDFRLREDLQPLLPAGNSRAAEDFRLISRAPFLNKVIVILESERDGDRSVLIQAADEVAKSLTGPYYERVLSGPGSSPEEFFAFILKATPALFTEADRSKVLRDLTPEGVKSHLQAVRQALEGPEGWVMKEVFREDPLNLRRLVLEKLASLHFLSGLTVQDGHFTSADGRKVLLLADTPVAITDSSGSAELLDFTHRVIKERCPPGIRAYLLSGHAYTAANAQVIRQDLFLILGSASIVILLLLFLFIQNWKALLVFLVPSSVIVLATAGIVGLYQGISAVTIAFGSVLMGIADDYPIFTFFSLRREGRFSGEEVSRTARPVLMSGLTTLAAFSALFFSDLPGQRQIALFSLFGIIASLAFSLFVLPHFLRDMPSPRFALNPQGPMEKGRPYRGWILLTWTAVLSLCVWQGTKVIFSGDLRAVHYVPEELRRGEEVFKRTWGDFREKAMLFVEGKDLESALQNNEGLFILLKDRFAPGALISFSPIFPSRRTQEENIRRWQALWDRETRERVRTLILREGERAGFAPEAFSPFLERLGKTEEPIGLEDLKQSGLGGLVDSLILRDGGKVMVMTLIPDSAKEAGWFQGEGASALPFPVRFVSPSGFNRVLGRTLTGNFLRYILFSSLIILTFLVLIFRRPYKVVCAMVPVLSGLMIMLGMMGGMGISFNFFNIIAAILVIGLSVDLGIFMISRIDQGFETDTGTAVLLSALTSLVGMGALTLARHPALYSMGITVLLGVGGAIPAALWVVPALYTLGKGDGRG